MGLFINTNQSALNAQRQLNNTTSSLGRSFERLSSGLRINGAKDDAAGLSITTRFSAHSTTPQSVTEELSPPTALPRNATTNPCRCRYRVAANRC